MDIEELTKDYIKEYQDDLPKEDIAIVLVQQAYKIRFGKLLKGINKSTLNSSTAPQEVSRRIKRYRKYLEDNGTND